MPKFHTIKAGDQLWDCHSEQRGNTTMREMGSWPVRVKEVDPVKRQALVSWNGNPPAWRGAAYIERLRRSPWKGKR